MVRLPCSECQSIDHNKFRSIKNRGGVKIPYMATYCVECAKEKRREYVAKNHKKIKARMKIYIKKWDAKNRQRRRDIINKCQRKKALEKKYAVDWHYTMSQGFNRLTYSGCEF